MNNRLSPKNTKILLFMIIAIFFLVLISSFFMPILGNKIDRLISPQKYKPIEYTIVGEYNDKFDVIKQFKTDFPQPSFDYKIYEISNSSKNLILEFNSEDPWTIKAVHHDSKLKVYSIFDFYLYKLEGETTFKSVSKYYLQVHPEEFPLLKIQLNN